MTTVYGPEATFFNPSDFSDDPVNAPAHYRSGGLEAISVIEAFGLGFRLGNCVKYVLRAEKKGNRLQDLKKARWYLEREIAREEAAQDVPRRHAVSHGEEGGTFIAPSADAMRGGGFSPSRAPFSGHHERHPELA